MRILFIGDIVGSAGCEYVCRHLNGLVKDQKIDFVIVNGENIGEKNGISPQRAMDLRLAGVDVITLGNHALGDKSIFKDLEDQSFVIRPYNLSSCNKGSGYTIVKTPFGDIAVVALQGQVNMISADSPFEAIEGLLEKLRGCDEIIVDFHAEATSEKRAIGFYLDGRVTAVIGTHTHVQTNDAYILPKGTAYITDVGMTGGKNSVIGVMKENAIERFLTGVHTVFVQDPNEIVMNTVIIDTIKKDIKICNI